MTSSTSSRFWRRYRKLPPDIQDRARSKFSLWIDNPNHPSLQFKKVSPEESVWSVRITHAYRALGLREGDHVEWFWIGTHDEYDRILSEL